MSKVYRPPWKSIISIDLVSGIPQI